MLMHKFL
ncbi:hypothetical protein CFP56_027302 [Quercus suber]